jgi:ribosomal protein L14E/L6E/L27E
LWGACSQYDEGHGDRHYGHCVVAGIDRYPLKITKGMEKKKLDKRSKLKPFLKIVNYNHVMPTRSVPSSMRTAGADGTEHEEACCLA